MTDALDVVDPVDDPTLGPPAPAAPRYPDTPVGMLQAQYDEAVVEITTTRTLAQQYDARADAAETRRDQLAGAIVALGGEVPTPPAEEPAGEGEAT